MAAGRSTAADKDLLCIHFHFAITRAKLGTIYAAFAFRIRPHEKCVLGLSNSRKPPRALHLLLEAENATASESFRWRGSSSVMEKTGVDPLSSGKPVAPRPTAAERSVASGGDVAASAAVAGASEGVNGAPRSAYGEVIGMPVLPTLAPVPDAFALLKALRHRSGVRAGHRDGHLASPAQDHEPGDGDLQAHVSRPRDAASFLGRK